MKLSVEDPERYAVVKQAYDSYKSENYLVAKSPATADRFPVTGELAKRFQLPAGYGVTSDEFASLHTLAAQIDQHAAEQAAAKAAIEAAQAAK